MSLLSQKPAAMMSACIFKLAFVSLLAYSAASENNGNLQSMMSVQADHSWQTRENNPGLWFMPRAGSAPKGLKIQGNYPPTFASITNVAKQELVFEAEGFVALPKS